MSSRYASRPGSGSCPSRPPLGSASGGAGRVAAGVVVERALRQQRAAPKKSGELACAERLKRQRRQHREDVIRRPQRDPVEDLDQPPLARISSATPSHRRLRAADVILTQQQHLDREVRVRQQRWKRDQLVGPVCSPPADRGHAARRLHSPRADGTSADVDLSYLAEYGGLFAPLCDLTYFRQLRADPELGTIVWPNDAHVAPETLYAHAQRGATTPAHVRGSGVPATR
jgi:hypothetical protein